MALDGVLKPSRGWKWWGGEVVTPIAIGAAIGVGILGFHAIPPSAPFPPDQPSAVRLAGPKGHGSGVHIGNGYIVTAAHVSALPGIEIITKDGAHRTAELLWSNTAYDIAIYRAKPDGIASSPLDCSGPVVGEHVTAWGSPLDFDQLSTSGFVADMARTIGPWKVAVPVDMTILPGMSGGSVVDDSGQVVGINVGVATYGMGGVTGLGIVVPSTVVCELLAR